MPEKKRAPRKRKTDEERLAEEQATISALQDQDTDYDPPTWVAPEPKAEPAVTLARSGLVAYNERARNSQSVRLVQEKLQELGHWQVKADPAGYWGEHTQRAALAETGRPEPVDAARLLGFAVI